MSALVAASLLVAAARAGSPPSSRRLRPNRAGPPPAGRLRRRELARRRNREAATLCSAVASELRAGMLPAAALAAAAEELPLLRPQLVQAARAAGRGASMAAELEIAAAELGCARLSVAAAVFASAEVSGSGVADVLDRVGRGLVCDDEAAAELDALAAGPRATALVLAVLPVVAVAFATVLGLSPHGGEEIGRAHV